MAGVAFEVAGVVGVGVVAPLVGVCGLVVPDGEAGDLVLQVRTGGEVARRRGFLVRTPNHCSIMLSQDACFGVCVTANLGRAAI